MQQPKRPIFVNSSTEMASVSPSSLRDRFVKAREHSGLTQAEAAAKLGVSEGTVSRKERGEVPVKERDAEAMERLAEAANRSGEMVPRGTLAIGENVSGYSRGTRPLADILKGRRALVWLLAFRDEVRRLGANEDDEERFVAIVTNAENLSLFAESGTDQFTEAGVLLGMDQMAAVVRQRLGAAMNDDRPGYIRIAEKYGLEVAQGSSEPPAPSPAAAKKAASAGHTGNRRPPKP